MTSRAYVACGARSPSSHYDVILIVTSFATELATPSITDVPTDTLPHLIYEDVYLLAYAQSSAGDCSVKRVHTSRGTCCFVVFTNNFCHFRLPFCDRSASCLVIS